MTLDRRRFLKGAALGSGLAAFGGTSTVAKLARAQTYESDKHFIFCYFAGGWDILLGLDPRDPTLFNNSNMRMTRIQPGYEILPGRAMPVTTDAGITFGAYIGEMAAFADQMAVVRGMSMETVSHAAGRRRFITGRQPIGNMAQGSSGATWLASKFGQNDIIPNIAVGVETYNVDQPTYASALSANGINDLQRSLQAADSDLPKGQRALLERFLRSHSECESSKLSPTLSSAEISRRNAREMAEGRLAARFNFLAENTEMEALRDRYRIPNEANGLGSANARAALAAQAIMTGVSRVVSINVAGGLDTHSGTAWITQQGPRQRSGFNAIARLASHLQENEYKETGDSWLDHTVIVAFSEFSRTPLLNGRSGRDHHITGACALVGGGLRPGVYGQSADIALRPSPMNLATGRMDPENGVVPRPEHVLQTLLYHAGFNRDWANLSVQPIGAMLPTT